MALTIVQHRNLDKNDSSNPFVYSFASTPTNGNLLLIWALNESGGSLGSGAITGFTRVVGTDGASFQGTAALFYKWASSESNSYSLTDPGAGWNGNMVGAEISGGVGSGDPADAAVVTNVLSFATPVVKSVTTATDHALVFGSTCQTNGDPVSFVTPAGWTLLNVAGGGRGGAVWYIDKTPAGATGDQSITGDSGYPSINYTYAIKPAGGAAQDTPELRLGRHQMRQLLAQ